MNKYDNIILANLMKRIRIEHNDSTTELSKKLHVTQQYISEMENGRKAINPAVFDDLLRTYNIKFDNTVDERLISKLINEIAAAFIYDNSKLEKSLLSVINKTDIKYSLYYPTYLLSEYLYQLMFNKTIDNKLLLEQLENLFDVYTATEKLLYYAVLINHKLSSNESDDQEIIKILNESNEVVTSTNNELQYGLFATINYAFTCVYEIKGNIFNVIKCCETASEYFKKALMNQGFIYSKIYYIGNLIALGNFKEAEEQIDLLSIISANLGLNKCLEAIQYQKLLLSLLSNRQEEIENYLNIANLDDLSINSKLILATYCLLNKRNMNAKTILKYIKAEDLNSLNKPILDLVNDSIDDSDKLIVLTEIINNDSCKLLIYEKIVYLKLIADYSYNNHKMNEYSEITNMINRYLISY